MHGLKSVNLRLESVASRLALATMLLSFIVVGCQQNTEDVPEAPWSVEEVLSNTWAINESVSSYRMKMTFPTPVPGSTAITSTTTIWQTPDVLMSTALGEGDPQFQEGFQKGNMCFTREGHDGVWKERSIPCGDPSRGAVTLTEYFAITQPEFMEDPPVNSEESYWISGVAAGAASRAEVPDEIRIASWELEINKETELITRAFAYSAAGRSLRVIVELNDYDTSFDERISQIERAIQEDIRPN